MKNFINSLVLVCTFIFNYGASAEMTNNTSIKMITNVGDIQIELFNDKSPITAGNFIKYIEAGYFSGTIFHRVIKDFMIQGGGFDESMNQKNTLEPIQNTQILHLKLDKWGKRTYGNWEAWGRLWRDFAEVLGGVGRLWERFGKAFGRY